MHALDAEMGIAAVVFSQILFSIYFITNFIRYISFYSLPHPIVARCEIHGPSTGDHLFVKKLNVRRHQQSYKAPIASCTFELFISSNTDTIYFSVEHEVTIDGDQEKYVAKGSNIRLTCRYKASPPVSKVQWIKDGTVIVRNTSVLINDSRVTIPSFNESQIQLSITAASLKDKGNYTCRVTNILNSIQDTTMIIIEGKQ